MGSLIEINDTLKISKEEGFPCELHLEDYVRDVVVVTKEFLRIEFSFRKEGERLYHRPPARVFLVEEIDGKWLYWGHALITRLTLSDGMTQGAFKIIKLYDPEYQKLMTMNEAPADKSYF